MTVSIRHAAEEVLLKIYECSAKHASDTWSLESAFRALGRPDHDEIGSDVFDLMIGRGWIVATNDFFSAKLFEDDDRINFVPDDGVTITTAGKVAAARILGDREPRSVWERLKAIPRSDWIAILALIISMIALLK